MRSALRTRITFALAGFAVLGVIAGAAVTFLGQGRPIALIFVLGAAALGAWLIGRTVAR